MITHDLDYNLFDLKHSNSITLNQILKNDSDFLRSHNLMDYSMLLTIEYVLKEEYTSVKKKFMELKSVSKLRNMQLSSLRRVTGL